MSSEESLGSRVTGAMSGLILQADPWPWAYHPRLLSEPDSGALCESFPSGLLRRASSADQGGKTYRLRTAVLGAVMPLPDPWRALYACLTSRSYRQRLEAVTQRPLGDCALEVSIWEYGPQDWLGPHVDKPDKVVTQIIYLSAGWQAGWGGRLLILPGPGEPPSAALAPMPGASSVVIRSDTSWHAVEPVDA